MLILGISALEHDAAAALVRDAEVVAAMEEDKLNRSPAYGGIPRLAMDLCARQAGISLKDIPIVAQAGLPWRASVREERFRLSLLASRPQAGLGTGALGRMYRAWNHQRQMARLFSSHTKWLRFEHHLCHAACAFYQSPFDTSLILTLDECGDMLAGMAAVGTGQEIQILHALRFPNSIGWFYSGVTALLGCRARRDEHKTQWLGKDGKPRFLPILRKIFRRDAQGFPALRRAYLGEALGGRWGLSQRMVDELSISAEAAKTDPAVRADLACSVQDWLEETVLELAENLRKKTLAKNLSVSGGVFQNVLLVRALETCSGFEKVFVHPVPGSAGTSVGAALMAERQLSGRVQRKEIAHTAFGPEFASEQIKAVLDNCKVVYRYYRTDAELLEATVALLREDKIVAWYQGRVEFGLRALGNRSILASPFSPYVIENLNQYIKHREDFHPFALSVPADAAGQIFECSSNCRFMASIGNLKANLEGLQQFAFRGNQVRVHMVERLANPRFYDLLKCFGATQLAPVLVNTSFNLFGEPLVCDPREAIRSFYCSGIDALTIGNFIVVK